MVGIHVGLALSQRQSGADAGVPIEARLSAERLEQIVPNGIDTDRCSRRRPPGETRRLRREHGLDLDRPLVLFVGFFSHDKQPRVLFDAWLRLRDVHGIDASLVFVGATKSGLSRSGREDWRTACVPKPPGAGSAIE